MKSPPNPVAGSTTTTGVSEEGQPLDAQPSPIREAFPLGAGFSRAIHRFMPLVIDLSERLMPNQMSLLSTPFATPPPGRRRASRRARLAFNRSAQNQYEPIQNPMDRKADSSLAS